MGDLADGVFRRIQFNKAWCTSPCHLPENNASIEQQEASCSYSNALALNPTRRWRQGPFTEFRGQILRGSFLVPQGWNFLSCPPGQNLYCASVGSRNWGRI